MQKVKTKRSVLLLISALLGLAYTVYLISYFGGTIGADDAAAAIGGAIATALVTPHMVMVALATIFTFVAYFTNKFWAALTGGILFSVAGVIFIMYMFFVVPSLVLAFIGCARLKKINEYNKHQTEMQETQGQTNNG